MRNLNFIEADPTNKDDNFDRPEVVEVLNIVRQIERDAPDALSKAVLNSEIQAKKLLERHGILFKEELIKDIAGNLNSFYFSGVLNERKGRHR